MNAETMPALFTGAFKADDAMSILSEDAREKQKCRHIISREKPDYFFESSEACCFVYGRIYDTEKCCRDAGIPQVSNPAEAISRLLIKDNYRAIGKVSGEFIFLFSDKYKIALGRDICGAGSELFYNSRFFSTRMRVFRQELSCGFDINEEAIRQYLHLGCISSPLTAIRDIRAVAPGEILLYASGKLTHEHMLKYDDYASMAGSFKGTDSEAVEVYSSLHNESVRRRLSGAEQPALLLSGGLDSGGNLAALRRVYPQQLHGYSVGFSDDPWSEIGLAQQMATHFNVQFSAVMIQGDEIEELPRLASALENPFQENGLMVNYVAMKHLSDKGHGIIFGGDANDQLFGTGSRELALQALSHKFGITPFLKLIQKGGRLLPKERAFSQKLLFHSQRVLEAGQLGGFGFDRFELKKMMAAKGADPLVDVLSQHGLNDRSFEARLRDAGFFVSLFHDGFNLIIQKASRMAAMHGQALTFPYLDPELIYFVLSLPREFRVSGSVKDIARGRGRNKWLHRQCFTSQLPPLIMNRKKQGGFAPLEIFFRNERRQQQILQYISHSRVVRELCRKDEVASMLRAFAGVIHQGDSWFWHRQAITARVFTLLMLAVWYDIHIENQSVTNLSDFIKK